MDFPFVRKMHEYLGASMYIKWVQQQQQCIDAWLVLALFGGIPSSYQILVYTTLCSSNKNCVSFIIIDWTSYCSVVHYPTGMQLV